MCGYSQKEVKTVIKTSESGLLSKDYYILVMIEYKEIIIKQEEINLHKIAESGQCFRWKQIGEQDFFVIAGGKAACFTQKEKGISIFCRPEDEKYFRNYLDLEMDYGKIEDEICQEDTYLCCAAQEGRGIRILRQDLWETIISFIISQRNNIPRIKNTIDAICEALGEKIVIQFAGKEWIGYTFPGPEKLAEADLTPFKLGYRQTYLEKAAKDVIEGKINLEELKRMEEKQAHDTLCRIKGVGIKVASCIQLFGLHQLSVFPVDTWIKKVEEQHYGGHFPVEKYEGYAGIIQQFFFFYARGAYHNE